MSDVIFYIAMALFVICAIGYGVYLSMTIKDKLRLDIKVLLKKNTLVLQGFSLGIVLSLILFTVAFYQDSTTINYINENNLVLDAGHQFLSYFFLILFGVCAMSFFCSLISCKREAFCCISWSNDSGRTGDAEAGRVFRLEVVIREYLAYRNFS